MDSDCQTASGLANMPAASLVAFYDPWGPADDVAQTAGYLAWIVEPDGGRGSYLLARTSPTMREIPAYKAYRLLEAGPIVLVTTAAHGRANVMTMGFHMMIQHNRPLIGCIIGPWDHSYTALRESGECVICIPGVDLATKVVD